MNSFEPTSSLSISISHLLLILALFLPHVPLTTFVVVQDRESGPQGERRNKRKREEERRRKEQKEREEQWRWKHKTGEGRSNPGNFFGCW